VAQSDPALEIRQLTKTYVVRHVQRKSLTTALDNVSITIRRGEIYALLGLNGAGKTTLMKIVLGLTRATKGSVTWSGMAVDRIIQEGKVGYLPELLKAKNDLTVKGFLKYIGQICEMDEKELKRRVDYALDEFGLQDISSQKLNALSKGTLKRVVIAQALMNEPDLLLLDEPTDGLDPVWQRNVRERLISLKKNGTTIVLSSHLLSEIEVIADRVGILQKGKLVAEGTVQQLLPPPKGYVVRIATDPGVNSYPFQRGDDGQWWCSVEDQIALRNVLNEINARGIGILAVTPVQANLEDVFISLVNQGKE